jgi:AraC-like DNA-binding protein
MLPIKYIAQSERDEQWGLTVCSTGYQHILPQEEYPPRNHEYEYVFNPTKGRTINEYQILYIVEGKGRLETASAGSFDIQEGDVFLLFPGEWHTYCPDENAGWKEYWIGFSGVNIDSRVAAGFFSKESPLYRIGYNETMVTLFKEAIHNAKKQEKHFQQLLAGIVNYMLGIIFTIDENKKIKDSMNHEIVEKAREFMLRNIDKDIEIPAIAEYLNISYSSFRHTFKQYTGIAPSQYYLNLKIQRAKDMLRSTSAPIKEISFQLHFDTPEYFTKLFKIKTGMTPSQFREQ